MSRGTHTVLRERLLAKAGVHDPAPLKGVSYDELRRRECSDGFCEMMDNRIVMGHLRYGSAKKKRTPGYDLNRAFALMAEYRHGGNTELLVDAANWLRLEFLRGTHPTKHFKANDR